MPTPQAQPNGQPWPGATKAEQWQNFDKAKTDWTIRQAERNFEARQETQRITEGWRQAVERTIASDPQFADYPQTIAQLQINPATKAFVLRNPDVGPKILYLLGKNPQAAAAAAALNPDQTIELLTEMKIRLSPAAAPAGSEAAAAPPPKITRTSKPAAELSNRNAAPADPIEAAVARRDVRSYIREANAKDLGKR